MSIRGLPLLLLAGTLAMGCSRRVPVDHAPQSASQGLVATAPSPSRSDMGREPSPPDVGGQDAATDALDLADSRHATRAKLCVKGPGTHESAGKGASSRDEPDAWRRKAKRINAGLVVTVDDQETSVRGKEGGTIENLDPAIAHHASVRYSDGGRQGGFRFRFEPGQTEVCAYYNASYDTWRVREVGRRKCGPCGE